MDYPDAYHAQQNPNVGEPSLGPYHSPYGSPMVHTHHQQPSAPETLHNQGHYIQNPLDASTGYAPIPTPRYGDSEYFEMPVAPQQLTVTASTPVHDDHQPATEPEAYPLGPLLAGRSATSGFGNHLSVPTSQGTVANVEQQVTRNRAKRGAGSSKPQTASKRQRRK